MFVKLCLTSRFAVECDLLNLLANCFYLSLLYSNKFVFAEPCVKFQQYGN